MRKLLLFLFLTMFVTNVYADSQIYEITELDATPATTDEILISDTSNSNAARRMSIANLFGSNAATASALESDPTDCSATQFATTIAASGNLTCAALTDTDVPNDLTIASTSALSCTSIDTGEGATEVFAMDQDVQTTDAPTFATIDTGQGANELYDLPLATGADADSSTVDSDSGLEIVSTGLTLLRGCSDNEILKWDESTDDWNCEADSDSAGTGDDVSVDGVEVTDPDFVSTGDIDFVDTSNDITGNINADKIKEPQINAIDTPSDNECLTYNLAGTNFEWQSCAGTETNDLETNDPPNVADTEIYIGTGPGTGAWSAMSGVIAMTNAGVTSYGLASIDGDDINSNIAGNYITWNTASPDTFTVDAAIYTDTKCIWFEDPTENDDFESIWTANGFAATITKIWCESDQEVQADLAISGSDVNGTDLVCDATPAEDESMGGDATLADGEQLDLLVESVSGTPTWVSICWTYTKDD